MDKYEYGEIQDEKHVYDCPNLNAEYTMEDIGEMNDNAIQLTEYWDGKI